MKPYPYGTWAWVCAPGPWFACLVVCVPAGFVRLGRGLCACGVCVPTLKIVRLPIRVSTPGGLFVRLGRGLCAWAGLCARGVVCAWWFVRLGLGGLCAWGFERLGRGLSA